MTQPDRDDDELRDSPRLSSPDACQRLREAELSEWAEQSAIASRPEIQSHYYFGSVIFWFVIALLLMARFFLIDPSKLRPAEAAIVSPGPLSASSSANTN